MKKILFSFLFLVVGLAGALTFGPDIAKALSPDYNVHINTPVIATNPLTISGTTTSGKYVGQPSAQHVVIDWGDGSPNTDMQIPLANINTANNTFSWNWGPITHAYTNTTTQSFTIVVKVCHTQCTGAEGSGDSTDTSIVLIPPLLSVTNSPQTYDGSPKIAIVSAGVVAGVVSDVKYNGSSTAPTNVGTYAITADFAPANPLSFATLNDAPAGNFVINKANTTTTVTCSDVTYNGAPQTPCTATVTGPGLSLNPTPVYSNNINAGTASASYTYTGTTNYNGSANSANFNIAKANAGINVIGYIGTYDGVAHGATGTATGVLSELLSGLDLGSLFTNVPGGIANWIFTDVTGNYNNNSGTADIVINPRDITITADAKGKNFGASDPALTYTVTSGSLVGSDSFSGNLNRDDGEDVGTYTINQGTVLLNSNYNLNYESGLFTIGLSTINVTADQKTKVYGSTDPELTYQFSPALADGDEFSGTLSRATGEDVGTYGIGQGNLSLNSNYNLSFAGNIIEITPAPLTVTADAKTKVYGSTDPELTYQITSGALVGSDVLSGDLSRDIGENVGTYTINQGTLMNGNYDITFGTAILTITKASQTIVFDPLDDKIMEDPDFDVNASSSSGLVVTFSIEEGSTCTIEGNTIHITGVGVCTVIAHQAGNENYNAAEDVSQSFKIATLLHTVTSSTGANGTVSPLGSVSVADGQDKLFNITPDSGYHVVDVLVDNVSVGAVSSYSFINVTADHTISASFAQNVVVKKPSSGGGLSGGGSAPQCSDKIDNDNDGVFDETDPGCHSDGDASNPDSYVPSDNSELSGEVLGVSTEICNAVVSYMRRGHKNDNAQVKILQGFLNDYMKSTLIIDGLFGPKTETSVKSFQLARKENILTPWKLTAPTGIFYKTSLAEAKRLMCPDEFGTLPIPTNLVPWSQGATQ